MTIVSDKRMLNVITEELKTIVIEECGGYFLARGEAKGQAEGRAQAVLLVLQARNLALGDEHRQQILECRDVGLLDRWISRAAVAGDTSEVITAT